VAKRSSKFLVHTFGGGWATDFGFTAYVPIQGNRVELPWLNAAENCYYELDGGPHKIEGMTKNFASALESSAAITGIYDLWLTGTSGTPAQHRVMHVGTKIKKDDADDSFSDLFTSMTAGSTPDYTVFEDLLIMSNENEVPKSWDGSTAQNLAGSPPRFAFSTVHRQKCWAAGVKANPSTLYYSVNNDPADWASAGSGSITIDPDDGDRITGIVSFQDRLYVFKGPYKGSIHFIEGSAPTGSDAFARRPFAKGIGCVAHNTITHYMNDVAFTWQGGEVHTLSATEKYGDFEHSALTNPIANWLRENANLDKMNVARTVNWQKHSLLLFAIPTGASSTPNMVLMYDYRFQPGRWAQWSKLDNVHSLAEGYNASTGLTNILAGCDDGFLRTLGQENRNVDGTESISMSVATPFLQYELPEMMKQFNGGALVFNPRTDGTVVFGWRRDGATRQTENVSTTSPGVKLGTFILGTDTLGVPGYGDNFFRAETGGEFRAIQFDIANNIFNEDVEIHSINALITPGGESFEA